MGEYEVRLERAAVEGFADLSGGDAKQVDKALGKLETSPELGKPLGNRLGINLTGCRKLTLCNRRVRVVYRIEDDQHVRVVVIGKREDSEVYRLAFAEMKRLGLR